MTIPAHAKEATVQHHVHESTSCLELGGQVPTSTEIKKDEFSKNISNFILFKKA